MQPGDAADVRRLMSYEERTAGGLMTTEPIVLRPDATVADALARIRNPDLSPALAAQVYVCRPPDETPTGKYLGAVHFQRLLRDPPFTLVGSIVDDDLQPLPPDTALPVVAGFFATYDMVAAPVVDESGSLLGAVTVDDVLDHMLPEDWRETEFHLRRGDPADVQDADRGETADGRRTTSAEAGRRRRGGAAAWGRHEPLSARPASAPPPGATAAPPAARPAGPAACSRGAGSCPNGTRRPSAGSPSASPASWAPGGSSSG